MNLRKPKNILKVVNATKLLDEEITRVTKILDNDVDTADVNNDKEHIVMIDDIDNIKSLIDQQIDKNWRKLSN